MSPKDITQHLPHHLDSARTLNAHSPTVSPLWDLESVQKVTHKGLHEADLKDLKEDLRVVLREDVKYDLKGDLKEDLNGDVGKDLKDVCKEDPKSARKEDQRSNRKEDHKDTRKEGHLCQPHLSNNQLLRSFGWIQMIFSRNSSPKSRWS
jgi:hypothetical protein